ncbi:MAG: tRNA (adenosine(37)-N6)-threonylcarbamoyltransferase complex ATPase subunit type 1 TsaE [Planctomycetota bacterium]|nr:MAG: tRNA (adenosine(37)-N6)-threonylcarbamoyltransferase complex ATPase subunit type 1 TsaE [Planctomycetota bacterium]
MGLSVEVQLANLAGTAAFAQLIAPQLQADDWLLLEGEMGSGKTTLVRHLVAALGGNADAVSSPSYALMNAYVARLPVWHVDAWRLHDDEGFAALGLDDLAAGGLVIVEWPSRIPELANLSCAWRLHLRSFGGDERAAKLSVPLGRPMPDLPPLLPASASAPVAMP